MASRQFSSEEFGTDNLALNNSILGQFVTGIISNKDNLASHGIKFIEVICSFQATNFVLFNENVPNFYV